MNYKKNNFDTKYQFWKLFYFYNRAVPLIYIYIINEWKIFGQFSWSAVISRELSFDRFFCLEFLSFICKTFELTIDSNVISVVN